MSTFTNQQLGPRLRADLEWSNHVDQARWVVRDPLTASFYSFSEVERQAAALMTGGLNLTDIIHGIRQVFPSASVDIEWLNALLIRLQRHHLLIPSTRAATAHIAAECTGIRTKRWIQQVFSPLAIRVPLFNPTHLLNSLRPLSFALFHPLTILFWLLAGSGSALLVLRELLNTGLIQAFDVTAIQGDRWVLLFICYLVAKSLHELGHGLACVRYRAECNEIGLMFLCLAPCLYCDTTDSWKLSSKWQRAGIAAAGMYIEWILATLAAAVWLLTQDGTAHYVAASLMVVCSIGTVLVNSNPLLKYDGYYILSDLWNVPNLADQGRDALRSLASYVLAGRSPTKSHFDAPILSLAAYALIASVYRLFILGAILWISWSVLLPLGLGLIAVLLTGMLLGGLAWGQMRSLRLFFIDVLASGSIKVVRWIIFFTLLLLLLAAVVAVPFPSVIRARAVTDYEDKVPLFASQTSELVVAAPVNQRLPQNSVLLEFESADSQFELSEVRGQVAVLQEELKQLRLRSAIDPNTAYELPVKSEQLSEYQGKERVLSREIAAMRHTAPFAGYLLAGPQPIAPSITAPRDDRFSKHPVEPSSLGATCDRSTLMGWFSKKEQLTLTLIVPEEDVKRLKVGMSGAIQWDSKPGDIGSGVISRIAADPISETPVQLIGDPMLVSTRNERGVFLPDKPHYEVTLQVKNSRQSLWGSPATVQIEMPAQTLWRRAVELIRQNLKPL